MKSRDYIVNVLVAMGLFPNSGMLLLITEDSNPVCKEFIGALDRGRYKFKQCSIKNSIDITYEEEMDILEESEKALCCLIVTVNSISYSRPIQQLVKNGVRVISMPGIDKSMFDREILLLGSSSKRITSVLLKSLIDVKTVRVETVAGTNITFSVQGRKPLASFSEEGAFPHFCNLPQGEVAIAPIEGSAEGVISFDGSFGRIVFKDSSISVVIEKGQIKNGSIIGANAGEIQNLLKSYNCSYLFQIGEFGIGTNDKAVLRGNVLEDEKVLGTCHFGFGNNIPFGGTILTKGHVDAVLKKPTIFFDNRCVMENGNLKKFF